MKNRRNYVKMGIVHFMAFPETIKGEGPIVETIAKIAEDDFFEAIEITWIKDLEIRTRVKEILQSSGLTIGYGAQPPLLINKLNLNSLDKTERQKAIRQLIACKNEALYLGAERFAVLSGPDPGFGKRKAAREVLIESLKEICGYLPSIPVVLETFDRNIDKKCLIGPAEEATEIAEKVRKEFPSFGIMYDLSHTPLLKEDSKIALKILKDYLVHVHIGNCVMKNNIHPAYGDQHPPFAIKDGENGIGELSCFLFYLFDIGYLNENKPERPIVSFEVKPLTGQKPEIVIAQSKRIFREAWRLL